MKKLGLLIVGAFLLISCDATPGGNKDVLPVVHDGIKAEVDHHAEGHGHEGHEAHTEENHDAYHTAEEKDTTHTAEKKDTVKVDVSTENASH